MSSARPPLPSKLPIKNQKPDQTNTNQQQVINDGQLVSNLTDDLLNKDEKDTQNINRLDNATSENIHNSNNNNNNTETLVKPDPQPVQKRIQTNTSAPPANRNTTKSGISIGLISSPISLEAKTHTASNLLQSSIPIDQYQANKAGSSEAAQDKNEKTSRASKLLNVSDSTKARFKQNTLIKSFLRPSSKLEPNKTAPVAARTASQIVVEYKKSTQTPARTSNISNTENSAEETVDAEKRASTVSPSPASPQNESSITLRVKRDEQTASHISPRNLSINIQNNLRNATAAQKFESIFGPELANKLICDNTNRLIDTNRKSSYSTLNIPEPTGMNHTVSTTKDIDSEKRQRLHEYSQIELKQANLLKILATNVYRKLYDENARQQYRLCDQDDMMKVFYVIVELEQLASLVHGPVANQIKERADNEWSEKPYFGDILTKNYHFYKVYKAILERYPTCQVTLSNLLKKKNFAAYLKKLLEAETANLEKVNRIDMLLDRLVDFPRRCVQLLEEYLKLLDPSSNEYIDIKKVYNLYKEIFDSSNEQLNKMNNFQLCYELQYMIEPPLLNIVDQNRQMIKQAQIHKVAKRSGEFLLRHLALFTDMLLICKIDRIRRKLILNYKIFTKDIKLIVNSNESNEMMFRILSSDENNEFKTDTLKEKEDWMKAFRKAKDISIIEDLKIETTEMNPLHIGVIPPIWVKDNEQSLCSGCKEGFTAFKRRHHCRTCGRIYCYACCNIFIPVKFNNFTKGLRVCRHCYKTVEKDYNDHLTKTKNLNDESVRALQDVIKPPNITSPIVITNSENQEEITTSSENINSNSLDSGEALNGRIEKTVEKRRAFKIKKTNEKEEVDTDDRSSSPLTEEQLELIKGAFEDGERVDETDDDDSETEDSSDELIDEKDANAVSPTIISKDKEKPPVPSKPDFLLRQKSPAPPPLPPKSNHNSVVSPPKGIRVTGNIRLTFKRDPVHEEFGYFSKQPIVDPNDTEAANKPDDNSNTKWSRKYLVLFSDHSIGVCSSQKEVNSPIVVIQLGAYELKEQNETTFSLTINQIVSNRLSTDVLNDTTPKQSDQDSSTSIGNLKNKLKKFESNYEIMFNNKNSKSKWINLIQNQKSTLGY